MAGMPVVSENSLLTNNLDVKKYGIIHFCKYDEIPFVARKLIRVPVQTKQKSIDAVINERNMIFDQVLDKINNLF